MLKLSLLLALIVKAGAYTEVGLKNFMYKDIDPIAFFGTYNSHMHTFFGSDEITLNTTTSDQLRAGCTTASNPNDLSTYWIPTLYVTTDPNNEAAIPPEIFSAYYENLDSAEIPFPENYKVRAGNNKATTQADTDPDAKISWFCEGDPAIPGKDAAAFPTETCTTHLQTLVFFPDCVNPNNLSSHGYSGGPDRTGGNGCPENMSRIPRLRMSIRYDLRKAIPNGWSGPPPLSLSSGNSFSSHGDFFNGWDTAAAANMLKTPQSGFSFVSGGRGPGGAGHPNCVAMDADPNGGSSPKTTLPGK